MIELILVIVILGILAATTIPNVIGVSPTYRLRGGVRELGSTIGWVKSLAGSTGNVHCIKYDIDRGEYSIILPPAADAPPDQPYEDREELPAAELPVDIVIEAIIFPDGSRVDQGAHFVPIDTYGTLGSHIVYMVNEEEGFTAISFNALLGVVDFSGERIEFEEF